MYVLKTSSSTLPWQLATPFSACTSAMSAWTESALERLAPETLLCTAGVGLAFFTVGFCTSIASRALLFLFVCTGTASSCLTAGCCTGATRGFGRITAAFVACASPPTAEAGTAPERAAPGRFGVGRGSAGLAFCNAGFCTDAAA